MRRLLGYLVIAVGLMWLVAGCALWPSAFDSQEHARLVNIQVASQDSSVCANPEQVKAISMQMYRDAAWAHTYGSSLPDNSKMSRMESNLLSMTKELADRYQQATPPSAVYCRSKFENIHRGASTITAVSARRPRL